MDAKIKVYDGAITKLNPDEVFVFGANLAGFHGAGAAGFASFGVTGNRWREFGYDRLPNGWKGKWAVKGSLGLQTGTEGKSFALVTVTKPGHKRSFVPDFAKLFECCNEHPDWKFYLAQPGSTGLNGWSPEEMARFVHNGGIIPENLFFDRSFAPFLEEKSSLF